MECDSGEEAVEIYKAFHALIGMNLNAAKALYNKDDIINPKLRCEHSKIKFPSPYHKTLICNALQFAEMLGLLPEFYPKVKDLKDYLKKLEEEECAEFKEESIPMDSDSEGDETDESEAEDLCEGIKKSPMIALEAHVLKRLARLEAIDSSSEEEESEREVSGDEILEEIKVKKSAQRKEDSKKKDQEDEAAPLEISSTGAGIINLLECKYDDENSKEPANPIKSKAKGSRITIPKGRFANPLDVIKDIQKEGMKTQKTLRMKAIDGVALISAHDIVKILCKVTSDSNASNVFKRVMEKEPESEDNARNVTIKHGIFVDISQPFNFNPEISFKQGCRRLRFIKGPNDTPVVTPREALHLITKLDGPLADQFREMLVDGTHRIVGGDMSLAAEVTNINQMHRTGELDNHPARLFRDQSIIEASQQFENAELHQEQSSSSASVCQAEVNRKLKLENDNLEIDIQIKRAKADTDIRTQRVESNIKVARSWIDFIKESKPADDRGRIKQQDEIDEIHRLSVQTVLNAMHSTLLQVDQSRTEGEATPQTASIISSSNAVSKIKQEITLEKVAVLCGYEPKWVKANVSQIGKRVLEEYRAIHNNSDPLKHQQLIHGKSVPVNTYYEEDFLVVVKGIRRHAEDKGVAIPEAACKMEHDLTK